VKILTISIFLTLALFGCKKYRDDIRGGFVNREMMRDLEKNRNELYRQSYVGVHNDNVKNDKN